MSQCVELNRKLSEKFDFPQRDANHVAAFVRASESLYCQPIYLQICAEISSAFRCWVRRLPAIAGECALLITEYRDLLNI